MPAQFLILVCSLVFMGGVASAATGSATSKSSSMSKVKFQLNAFYGGAFGVTPDSINQKIDDLNVGATVLMPKIKNTTIMGAEVLNSAFDNFAIGIRYTLQSAEATQGIESNQPNQVVVDVQDLAGVAKYILSNGLIDLSIGVTGGISLINDITVTDVGTKTKYSSPNGFVGRGFLGARYELSFFTIWGEGGYQYLKDKAYKTPQGIKPTTTAGDMDLDLSGPYAVGGVGIQF